MPEELLASLNEAIGGLAAVAVDEFDDASLRSLVLALESTRTRLESVCAGFIAELDRTGAWASEGAYSAAHWLRTQTGCAAQVSGSRVRTARRLGAMPLTAEAFGAAEITESHVRVMAKGVGPRTRELFGSHEADLLSAARRLPADDFAKVMERWLSLADADGAEPRAERPDELHVSETLEGRVVGRFSFSKELGLEIAEAIKAKTDELFHRDKANREVDPTDPGLDDAPAARRARALSELVEQGLGAKASQRRQPAFTIITKPQGDGGRSCETFGGSHVHSGLAAVLFCDCYVSVVELSPKGVPLNVGREERRVNRAQRRALAARSGGRCEIPGCDRPATWCDAHHIQWWSRGGRTDIGNLVLLCRHHHRRVHGGHLEIRMVESLPRTYLPDGRELVDPRSQRWRPPPSSGEAA